MNIRNRCSTNADADKAAKIGMQNIDIKPLTDDETPDLESKDDDIINAFVDDSKDDQTFLKNKVIINESM